MTRPLVFSDLDESLFQTVRKMQGPPDETLLAATATNAHHSYMTAQQDMLVHWLLNTADVVPVTARSTQALARCTLAFTDWQIAANGAVLLSPDGVPDPKWMARTAEMSAAATGCLDAMQTSLDQINPQGRFRHWIVTEFGVPIYYCVKSNGEEAWLSEARAVLDPIASGTMRAHHNGNNLSYTPIGISKQEAVRELFARIGHGRVSIGIGDSLTDLPFMQSCTMMMVPPRSQIARAIEGDQHV